MREIEVKAKVEDTKHVLAALSQTGVLIGEPVTQHDVVYARPGARDNDPEENWLRIRTENGTRTIFTLKRSVTGELDSIEHETEVADEDELAKIIEYLGYHLYSDLTKTRQKARIGDVEICLDKVDQLGVFVEAEKMSDNDADANTVQSELWQVLDSLGVSRQSEVTEGYDVLMRKKFGPPKAVTNEVKTVLLYLVRNNQILLAYKKEGFSEGKLNGIGGKVESSESSEEALMREAKGEVGITPTYFSKVGDLEFVLWRKGKHQKNLLEVYLCEEWDGEPHETKGAKPQWVPCDDLPFAEMWPTDQYWLPQIIAGERVKGVFEYDKSNQPTKHSVMLVDVI